MNIRLGFLERLTTMASDLHSSAAQELQQPGKQRKQDDKRHRSVFELPATFFTTCRLLQSPSASLVSLENLSVNEPIDIVDDEAEDASIGNATAMQRWSCNTCKAEFESLQEQRSHFKSDIHRLNVLSLSLIADIDILYFPD